MKKNVASQKIGCQMVTAADGSAFTGSVTVSVTGDAGTQATGSVGSGACTHEGNGYHTYAPAQAETNYDLVAFTFTGTGAIPATVQVFTSFPQSADNNTLLSTINGNVGTNGAGLTAIEDIVWDALKADHDIADTMGADSSEVEDIVDGVEERLQPSLDKIDTIEAAVPGIPAAVITELRTATLPVIAQGDPPAEPTWAYALRFLYKLARNKKVQTATELDLYDDAGTTVDHKLTASDSAGVATKGKFVSGP